MARSNCLRRLFHAGLLSALLLSASVKSKEEPGLNFGTQCDASDPTCSEDGNRYASESGSGKDTKIHNQKVLKEQSERLRSAMGSKSFEKVAVESHVMWVTPIEIFNVSVEGQNEKNNLEPYETNLELSQWLFNEYQQFRKKLRQKKIVLNYTDVGGGGEPSPLRRTINDQWFHYQEYLFEEGRLYNDDSSSNKKKTKKKNDQNKKKKSLSQKSSLIPIATLDRLKARLWELVHVYFARYGIMNSVAYLQASTPMFLWSTVLESELGDYQAPISHESSVLTVLYFVESGIDRHTLVISDPRGSGIPPFGHKHYIPLVSGQMAVFPSYLSYYIEPVSPMDRENGIVNNQDRTIVLNFLVKGDWGDMSDVSFRDRLTGMDPLFSGRRNKADSNHSGSSKKKNKKKEPSEKAPQQ